MSPREECVLLLDLSLRCTGYCVTPWPLTINDDNMITRPLVTQLGNVPPLGEYKLERASVATQQRVGMLSLVLGELIDTYHPKFIAAEMPTNVYQARPGGKSVGNMSSTMQQQRSFGAAMAVCWERGIPFVEVDPSWSKYCLTGERTASKRKVAENLAKRLGMTVTPGKPIRFPKGWTEAVRDAMAVILFLRYRQNLFGNEWLDILLVEQGKPSSQQHHPWRGLLYEDLMKEIKEQHSALPTQTTVKPERCVVSNKNKTKKVSPRYGRPNYSTAK